MKFVIILYYAILTVLLLILLTRLFNRISPGQPRSAGLDGSKFNECSTTPNCVSSMTGQNEKRVDAIQLDSQDADRKIKEVFNRLGAKLERSEANYYHYTFVTFPMGYTDDVELLIDSESNLIHIKSASRRGRYDFGTNLKRVNKIKATFNQLN